MDPFTITSLALAGTEVARGIIKSGQAKRKLKAYEREEASIPMQDPNQVALLGEARQRRRGFEAGTDKLTSYNQQLISNTGATTQANIVRAGRGNVTDLLRSQRNTDLGMAASAAGAAGRADQLFAMEGSLVGAMADRAYNRQLSRAQRLYAEYGQLQQDANASIQAATGMIPSIAGGMGGGAKKSPQSSGEWGFDPFASTSKGMGTYYPGAYDSESFQGPVKMEVRYPGTSSLPYTPIR